MPERTLPVMRMYGVGEGMRDLHHGANMTMEKGLYGVRVRVNGHAALLHVRIP
jgi:hypothetical protein